MLLLFQRHESTYFHTATTWRHFQLRGDFYFRCPERRSTNASILQTIVQVSANGFRNGNLGDDKSTDCAQESLQIHILSCQKSASFLPLFAPCCVWCMLTSLRFRNVNLPPPNPMASQTFFVLSRRL